MSMKTIDFLPLDLEPLLTMHDLETLLRVDQRTIYRLCSKRVLPLPIKLGGSNRWRPRDIEKALDDLSLGNYQLRRKKGRPVEIVKEDVPVEDMPQDMPAEVMKEDVPAEVVKEDMPQEMQTPGEPIPASASESK